MPDTWELRGMQLIRHHNTPRTEMFSPMESLDDCPIPIKYIDVWRYTGTDLAHEHEKSLHAVWVADESDTAQLFGQWVSFNPSWQVTKLAACKHIGR